MFRGLDPPPLRNVCPTRKNVTKMDINKFCMCFLGVFLCTPPPEKNLGYGPSSSKEINESKDNLAYLLLFLKAKEYVS